MGRETDSVAFLAALAERPYAFDFYQTLRRFECQHADRPRWGRALRPADEPVRLGQEPSLSFAPATVADFEAETETAPPRLAVRNFGLLGPNGPLPLHLTEYVRDRMRQHNDPTLSRFLDFLQHRFIALFYRAWAQAQPHVSLDRPRDDHFAAELGALIGLGTPAVQRRDAVPDAAKLSHSGSLARHVRNADGLASILRDYFGVPVRIESFVGHWLALRPPERTYLGRSEVVLGQRAVLGASVWDRQHKFSLWLGPLTLADYQSFLPGGRRLAQLVAWIRTYLELELEWDVRLVLRAGQVPESRLGAGTRLGWTSWLGSRPRSTDPADLSLDAERQLARAGVTA
jgi:type VI secretion system protein ImpH